MTKKKKLQRKKHLYRKTQVVARHVVRDPKRRRARFICQINECSRINEFHTGTIMCAVQYLCSVEDIVRRIDYKPTITICERFLKSKRKEMENCDERE